VLLLTDERHRLRLGHSSNANENARV
jgi:hypothetical protein